MSRKAIFFLIVIVAFGYATFVSMFLNVPLGGALETASDETFGAFLALFVHYINNPDI